MWRLYLEYEKDLKLNEPLNVLRELEQRTPPPAAPVTLTAQQIVQQMQALAQNGIGLGAVNEQQFVRMAAAMVPFVNVPGPGNVGKVTLDPIAGVYIESAIRADVFMTDLRLERTSVTTPVGPQEAVKQEVIWQRWVLEN